MYSQASRSAEVMTPTKIFIRSAATLRTRKVVIAGGAIYAAASLLGLVTLGATSSAVKASGANTGTGTFVLDASPVLARAKLGTYTLRCIAAAANGGTFRLEDPDGAVLGDIVLPGNAGGSVVVAEQIKGTLTDGATDFVVGDGFDVTIAAPATTNRTKLATSAATDGTQTPSLVLAYDVDATAGDVEAIAYESGDFVRDQLVVGVGIVLDTVRESLRRLNITFG